MSPIVTSGSSSGMAPVMTSGSVSGFPPDANACAQTACGALCISCSDQCVDPRVDTSNCGGCGVACPIGTICNDGTCVCPPGWLACVGEPGKVDLCVDAQTDPLNCGRCQVQCPDGYLCQVGTCVAAGGSPGCQPGGPGLTDCGEALETCCASAEVEGSTYYRTYTNDGSGPVDQADPALVSSFRLDKYLVTVGRFRQFVHAWNAGWKPAAGSGKHAHLNGGLGLAGGGPSATYEPGWVASDTDAIAPTDASLACGPLGTWTPSPGGNENLPITCVNWEEAYAFCIWDGGFLPSESEWEYAAAGGSQQREYPWGAIDPGTENLFAIYGCYYPSFASCMGIVGVTNIAPVGAATLGAGQWGQFDLAGESWEWTLDVYGLAYVDPCSNCAALPPTMVPGHVVRASPVGASSPVSSLHPDIRTPILGDESSLDGQGIGFRCARAP
jgi:sulfatase modifying factor 1